MVLKYTAGVDVFSTKLLLNTYTYKVLYTLFKQTNIECYILFLFSQIIHMPNKKAKIALFQHFNRINIIIAVNFMKISNRKGDQIWNIITHIIY